MLMEAATKGHVATDALPSGEPQQESTPNQTKNTPTKRPPKHKTHYRMTSYQ